MYIVIFHEYVHAYVYVCVSNMMQHSGLWREASPTTNITNIVLEILVRSLGNITYPKLTRQEEAIATTGRIESAMPR
jgi:hypothetical protein